MPDPLCQCSHPKTDHNVSCAVIACTCTGYRARSAEPVWFVVEIGAGGAEVPCIYRDVLPSRLTVKESALLVYQLRIDRLPNPDHFLDMTLPQLMRLYRQAEANGTLVHNSADAPRPKQQEGGRILGEYWQPKPVPYHPDPRVDGDADPK